MIRSLARSVALAAAILLLAACGGGDADSPPAAQCTVPADCGADTACRVRTCVAGVCGTSDLPASTVVLAQTTGDCRENRCDGAGGVTFVALDTDLPADDGNACTSESCSGGVPVHPPLEENAACSQDGGTVCDGAGACVACNTAAQCPGSDTECRTRTCVANACGFDDAPTTTVVAAQTPGDCRQNRCDGAGGVTSVASNGDLPDDGNQCTFDLCELGVPTHPNKTPHRPCDQNDGNVCDGNGACVGCVSAGDCPGVDTECRTRTCVDNACDASLAPDDMLVSSQTPGDCRENRCVRGEIVAAVADTDVPVDGNQCTLDVCTAGVPSNPAERVDTACSQNGGGVCGAAATCVQCNTASHCPPAPSECVIATCSAEGACGTQNEPSGTPAATQTAGDCQARVCDDFGGVTTVADDTDIPDDANACTTDTCSNGSAMHAPVADDTPCPGDGRCAAGVCVAPPAVAAVSPGDAQTAVAPTTIAVTFTTPMDPAPLSAQTALGTCSGSIQVSNDGFATCAAFFVAAPAMSGGDTVATLTPAPGLLVNRTYRVRVTSAARSAGGVALAATFTMPAGFTTASPTTCAPRVEISQVYGGGGEPGATYRQDFVELHNRGTAAVDVSGWTIQYEPGWTSGAWSASHTLPAGSVIPAGGFFLAGEAVGPAGTVDLPSPDATGSLPLGATAGKVALVTGPDRLAGSCPEIGAAVGNGSVVADLVAFGALTGCAYPAGETASTTGIIRVADGCAATGWSSTDFTVAAPAPRNAASAAFACGCTKAVNESNAPEEADFCTVESTGSISVRTGTSTPEVYGRIFEAGLTEAAGKSPSIFGQVGYGPASANPEVEPGWKWFPAVWDWQLAGGEDRYRLSLSGFAVGEYRYGFRFTRDHGSSWTYCDRNQGDMGAGSRAGYTFDLVTLPVLTVTP